MQKLSFDLPLLSKIEINDLLKKKPLEDLAVIKDIEKFFLKKRGYVLKAPKKATPIILLLSGGLDTSVIWDILMKKYKLRVYPIFIRRGQIRMPMEENSVDFFSKYYEKKYPKFYVAPKKLTTAIPPLEIRWQITKNGKKLIIRNPETRLGIPVYSSLLLDYAVEYSYFLELTQNIRIRDIFCGFMKTDGDLFKYETLTALRVNMYSVCNLTNDFSWQFTSLALEKEFGFFFGKDTLIKWAQKNHLPIERSNSCIKFSYYHCGKCDFCSLRKESFIKAGITDKTIYVSELKPLIFFKVVNKILLFISTAKFLAKLWIEFAKNFLFFSVYK